ncbi:MAG TPA: hypothetical protein VGO57_07855 [Verrucomicrobiae bacterium]
MNQKQSAGQTNVKKIPTSLLAILLLGWLLPVAARAQPLQQNWTAWQATSDPGIDVRYDRDSQVWVTWWWQFRNRYNQKAIIHYRRLYGNGQRMDDLAIADGNGFAMDNNLGGDYNPAIQVIKVELPDSVNSRSSGSDNQPAASQTAAQAQAQQQELQQKLQQQQAAIRQQQADLAAKQQAGLAKIQSYQDASASVQNAGNQLSQMLQEQQAKNNADYEQQKLERQQERLEREQERLQEEASKTPEQRAAEEQAQQQQQQVEHDIQSENQKKIAALIPSFAGTWEIAPDFIRQNNWNKAGSKLTTTGSGQLKLWLTDSGTLAGSGGFELDMHGAPGMSVQHGKYMFNIKAMSLDANNISMSDNQATVNYSGDCQRSYYERGRVFLPADSVGNVVINLTLGLLASPIMIPATFLNANREANSFQGQLYFSPDEKVYLNAISEFSQDPIPLEKVSDASR